VRTIAHISDLHFGRHNEKAATSLLSSVREAQPDIIVITGDLTQRGRRAQFKSARAFIEELPRPILVVPGNHDIPLYDLAERFLGRLARYRRYISSELHPFFADSEIAVLGLNTARSATFANGRISYEQAAAVGRIFADVPAGRFKVLATHHPLVAASGAENSAVVGRAAVALDAITKAGIQLVLAGHHHQAFSGGLPGSEPVAGRSILVVQAGTAISTRLRAEPNSYNLLSIEPAHVSCTVRVLHEGLFVDADTAEYTCLGDRWTRQ
jgi:3',5'-cyclic AMP phosphodiesterase CpdA